MRTEFKSKRPSRSLVPTIHLRLAGSNVEIRKSGILYKVVTRCMNKIEPERVVIERAQVNCRVCLAAKESS